MRLTISLLAIKAFSTSLADDAPGALPRPQAEVSDGVAIAPPENSDEVFDVKPDGACKDIIASECSKANGEFLAAHREDSAGYDFGRNGICLTRLADRWISNAAAPPISEECEIDVAEYFDHIAQFGFLTAFPEVKRYCKDVLAKECKDDQTIECLEREKAKPTKNGEEDPLNKKCTFGIFSLQMLRSQHWEFEPKLWSACEDDVRTLCPKVPSAQVRQCMQKFDEDLSDDCAAALFDTDMRKVDAPALLDKALQSACKDDLTRVCVDASQNPGQLLPCLYKKASMDLEMLMVWSFQKSEGQDAILTQTALEQNCRDEVVRVQGRALMDHRLNTAVRDNCSRDITQLCEAERQQVENSRRPTGLVMNCLTNSFLLIDSSHCALAVKQGIKWQQLGFQNLTPAGHKHCREDFEKYCVNQLGMECFLNNFNDLAVPCQKVLMPTLRYRELHLEFDPVLKHTCKMRIDQFCDETSTNSVHCLLAHISTIMTTDKPCGQLLQRSIERTQQDYQLKYGVSQFCKEDIEALCKGVVSSTVLQCLRDKNGQIKSKKCIIEIEDVIRGNALAVNKALCKADVEKYCKDVEVNVSHGEIHHCLLKNVEKLSDECANEEFNLAIVKGNKLRLHPNLERACARERDLLCKNMPDEDGSLMRCLEDSVYEASKMCQRELVELMQAKHRDFRLSPQFAFECREDIKRLCQPKYGLAEMEENQKVVQCMIDSRKNIGSQDCLEEVKRKIRQRGGDVRIVPNMIGNVCQNDMEKYCSGVQLGKGRMHACLVNNIAKLEPNCKVIEFKNQIVMNEDMQLDPSIADPCASLLKACEGQETFECLWDLRESPRMPPACARAVVDKTRAKIHSWWFNHELVEHCADDLNTFIRAKRGSCAGLEYFVAEHVNVEEEAVQENRSASRIQCITDNFRIIESVACRQAARFHVKLQVADPMHNRRGFFQTCSHDAVKTCDYRKDAPDPDHGYEVFKCLLASMETISKQCNRAISQVLSFFYSDYRLHPKIQNKCVREIGTFCHDLQAPDPHIPDGGMVFACLRSSSRKQKPFSDECKLEMDSVPVSDELVKYFEERAANSESLLQDNLRQKIEKLTAKVVEITTPGGARDFFTIIGMISMTGVAGYFIFQLYKRVSRKGYTLFVPKTS
eukprot:GEMP01002920.1.p1 GENE.GEMP01002920.1~~GEMP01002920.1.p1  ORF type:complete len:1181 (+),score=258.82 GEMP01002920.1:109-3543(+)